MLSSFSQRSTPSSAESASACTSGVEPCDLAERLLDGARACLVRDDVQRRAVLALVLHEACDRHVVLGEPLRDVRKDARLIGDGDA